MVIKWKKPKDSHLVRLSLCLDWKRVSGGAYSGGEAGAEGEDPPVEGAVPHVHHHVGQAHAPSRMAARQR